MSKIKDFLIGTDYEYFVKDNASGDIISAEGYVFGTKEEPMKLGNDCHQQLDCVLYEINQPPVDNMKDWLDYFAYTKRLANVELAKNNLQLAALSSVFMKDEYLRTEQANIFGCQPSECAYTNRPVCEKGKDGLRTAGFHIHIGVKNDDSFETLEDVNRLMQIMDYVLGLPSVLIDPDRVRRSMYGTAGEFRFHVRGDYMVPEYRALGGYFLNEHLLEFVWKQTKKAIKYYNEGLEFTKDEQNNLQRAIDTYDEEVAHQILSATDFYKEVIELMGESVKIEN